MESERIFSIDKNPKSNVFSILEACDYHFGVDLTAKNCRDLSELFTKIADNIDRNEKGD